MLQPDQTPPPAHFGASPLDFALPTDPQVNMGTRKTRTTPVRTARPEPPSGYVPFVSAPSMKPVQAGCPRPVVRSRGCHRPSRPPRDALAGRITIAHASPGRTSVHPHRPRRRRPLQHRPVDPGRGIDRDGGPADHPDRQGPDPATRGATAPPDRRRSTAPVSCSTPSAGQATRRSSATRGFDRRARSTSTSRRAA